MQSEQSIRSDANVEHRQLLYELKKSVDQWFLSRRDCLQVTLDDGENFLQVLLAIRNILLHGLSNASGVKGGNACAILITQLNWLQPAIYNDGQQYSLPTLQLTDSLEQWIYSNFQESTLCARLQLLVADLELLTSFYNYDAFLSNDRYATALFICLSALELNQSSLISQIDGCLYASSSAPVSRHKRSTSHPHFSISPRKASQSSLAKEDSTDSSLVVQQTKPLSEVSIRLRKCRSLPNVHAAPKYIRTRSKTISQQTSSEYNQPAADDEDLLYSAFSYHSMPSCSHQGELTARHQHEAGSSQTGELLPYQLVKCDDIKIFFDQGHDHNRKASPDERPDLIEYDTPPKPLGPIHFLSCISSNLFSINDGVSKDITASAASSFSNSNDFMSVFLPQEGRKLKRHSHSLFEDLEENPYYNLERRLPANGQTLPLFLQSGQFSRNNTDLERENAHFSMSEAIICVIEKMKCSKVERCKKGKSCSDLYSKAGSSGANRSKYLCRKASGSWNKSQSSFGLSASSFSEIEDSLEDSDRQTDGSVDDHCDLMKELIQNTESPNDHTAYAEWGGDSTLEAFSAEGVALSIISKFSDYQLPRASDITWLVSRKDARQDFLLMTGESPSADPDENYVHPVIRGTRDWAPPRQQIIFTDHPNPSRKKLLQQQNYRCTGCGMRVSRSYMNRFRYCTYLGKYHCTGCHRNQMSIIPAKVLDRWDFCYYPVSVFAYRLLEQIWTYPLFYVPDLNPALYTKIKSLSISKIKRIQLKFIQDFIVTCRFALDEKKLFDNIAAYITLDPDKWSMFDFLAVKQGSFPKTVSNLIAKCEEHVVNCELCNARGFICEICPKKQIIFPWQMRVKRCDNCGTCFHQKCWDSASDCVKCQRLRLRKQKIG